MAEEVHLPASVDASDISAFCLGVIIVVYAVHHCGARMPLLKSLQEWVTGRVHPFRAPQYLDVRHLEVRLAWK